MSDEKNSDLKEASPEIQKEELKADSFNVPVEKSPWLVYALLQIPIVVIMVIILYFMYQNRSN